MKPKKRSLIAGTAVLLALAMTTGCSPDTEKDTEPTTEPEPVTVTESAAEAVTQPPAEPEQTEATAPQADSSASGTIDTYEISILDAVRTTDYNGDPALVVNFNYKNNSDSNKMFLTSVLCTAFQNGVSLSPAVILNDSYDAQASMKTLQPGAELKVQTAYKLSDDSPVTVEVTPIINFNNEKLSKVFDIGQ